MVGQWRPNHQLCRFSGTRTGLGHDEVLTPLLHGLSSSCPLKQVLALCAMPLSQPQYPCAFQTHCRRMPPPATGTWLEA